MSALAARAQAGLWAMRDQLASRARREDGAIDLMTIVIGALGAAVIGGGIFLFLKNTVWANTVSGVNTQITAIK